MMRQSVGGRVIVTFSFVFFLFLASSSSVPQSQLSAPNLEPGQSATVLPNGRWLLVGGEGPSGPVNRASIFDPRTGATTPLSNQLKHARAWHSSTMLPDGSVLILGGIGSDGKVINIAEQFDSETRSFVALPPTGLMGRARHTATLLTDGRVLIVGGVEDSGNLLDRAQLWSFEERTGATSRANLNTGRQGHTATLMPDGNVLIWSGIDENGTVLNNGEAFDPAIQQFIPQLEFPIPYTANPELVTSIPVDRSVDVPTNSLIVLRFSKPLRVETANAETISLTGPKGLERVKVVPAEGGLLAFIVAETDLLPGATYNISINGLVDRDSLLFPLSGINFTTKVSGSSGQPFVSLAPEVQSQNLSQYITSGLLAHWKFDEGSGTTAADSSGNGKTATLVNGPTWTTGKIVGAVRLDGANDHVRTPFIVNPATSDLTAALWVRADTTTGGPVFLQQLNSAGTGRTWLYLTAGNVLASFLGGVETSGITSVLAGTWYHVALTKAGSTLRLYLNGGPEAQGTITAESTGGVHRIGLHKDGTRALAGLVDDARVYNRALSTAEIQQLYSLGSPDTMPPVRSSGAPSGTLPSDTTQTSLSLTTNENATCRYSTTAGTSYATMPATFSTTGGTSHSTAVSGLQGGQSYIYYAKCQDTFGNANTDDFSISFSVALPAAFDFSLSNSGNQTAPQGTSVTNTITATLTSGTSQSVLFSTSDLPQGTTSTYAPGSCAPTCTTTLTINTASSTPLGTYPVTVTATGGSLTKTTSFSLTVTAPPIPSAKPNIVWIMADDLGYAHTGPYGQTLIRTLNIDALASEGRRFTQVYAGSGVCCPSRSALMTGQHTGHTRLRDNFREIGGEVISDPGPLLPEDVTVAEVLKQGGYTTGLVGKWHLGLAGTTGIPNLQGFDYFYGFHEGSLPTHFPDSIWENQQQITIPENLNGQRVVYIDDRFTDKAVEFLTQNKNRSFFLYLTYNSPHTPYEVPTLDPYVNQPWTQQEKKLAAMVTRIDSNVGRVMAKLRELGLDSNTVVFFTSDNGEEYEPFEESYPPDPNRRFNGTPFREGKHTLYEGGIRVPMIVRWPGKIPAGTVSNEIWTFWDFLPTAAEIAGVSPLPPGIDGISALPALLGTGQVNREYLYWENPQEFGNVQALWMGNFKGVRKLEPFYQFELFDLSADPGETTNLSSQFPAMVQKMEGIMATGRTVSTEFPRPYDSAIICRQTKAFADVVLLSYSGSSPACADLGVAQTGERVYTDHNSTITSLPSAYVGSTLFRQANADKAFPWSTLARLYSTNNSIVAVAYDAGATILPSWLQGWTITGEVVRASGFPAGEEVFNIYTKSFSVNETMFLGGNEMDGGNGQNSYFALIKTTGVASFNFSLSNSGNQSVAQGSSITNTIPAILISGTSQFISFSTSGLPSGVTTSFSPSSCTPNCSTVLNLSISSSTSPGTYTATVTGSGGGVTKTTSFALTVIASSPGSIAHWKFDEGSGTSALDSSGNGNTATLVNGPTWTIGKVAGAVRLDGVNDYVRTPFLINPANTDMTAALWVKMDTTADGSVFLQQLDSGGTGRTWLYLTADVLASFLGGVETSGTTRFFPDTWYNVAVTKAGSTLRLYLNGVQETQGTIMAESTLGEHRIGIHKNGTRAFAGLIDQVRFFNRALSIAEIQNLYNLDGGVQ